MRIETTPVMLAIGALWAVVTLLGMTGHWFAALLLSVVLMVAHLLLGSAHKGRLSISLLIHPILTWAVVWAGSFVLAEHFAGRFRGVEPSFTILGLHPSFAWIVLGFWLGGVLTLSLGFVLRSRLWLSENQWNEFTDTVARLNAERDGEGDG